MKTDTLTDTLYIRGCDGPIYQVDPHKVILKNNNVICKEHDIEKEIKTLEVFPYAGVSLCSIAIYLHRQNRNQYWMKYMSPLVHRDNEIAIFPHSGPAIVIFRVYRRETPENNAWLYELANRYHE